ncbi:hypothetical protein [Klebsiella variicola]|uniref:hypothetical protein n=1 Tax=Klebsiella variicola TaxID=244366 RepID=UPI002FF66C02
MTAIKPAKHSTDKRARLRQAAQDYQSALSWYQENLDSPNAEQDCDEATAAFKREIGHREMDIIADLLDEMDELQVRLKAAMAREPMFFVDGEAAKRLLRGETRFAAMTTEPKPGKTLALYIDPKPALEVPDFKKLARELVDNLVDCASADDAAVRQYLEWTESACRAAMLKGGVA